MITISPSQRFFNFVSIAVRVFFVFALFSVASSASAATYYMRSDGTAASKTAATACGSAATAMSIATHNLQSFSAGDTIYLCSDGGNYSGTSLRPPSSGSSGNVITYSNSTGQTPVLDGTGLAAYVVNSNGKSYIIFNGLKIINATSPYAGFNGQSASDQVTVQNSVFQDNYQHWYVATGAGKSITITKSFFFGPGTIGAGVDGTDMSFAAPGTLNFTYNVLRPKDVAGGTTEDGHAPEIKTATAASGTLNIYNNNIAGCREVLGKNGSPTATVNFKNNVVVGCYGSLDAGYLINLSGVTTDVVNNYITPPIRGYVFDPALSPSNNMLSGALSHNHAARDGYVVFGVDDWSSNLVYEYLYGTNGTDGVAAEFVERGMTLVYYVDMAQPIQTDSEWITKLTWLKNHNIEIAYHTRSHPDLAYTAAITLTSTGTNATVQVNRTTHKIILTTNESGSVNVPATGNFENATIPALITEIDARSDWAAVKKNASRIGDRMLGEVLANMGSPANIGAGYDLAIDRTTGSSPSAGIFKSEFLDTSTGLSAVEAALGVTLRSFAYPFGANDVTAQTAIRTISGGQLTNGRCVTVGADCDFKLQYLNRYAYPSVTMLQRDNSANTVLGGTDADLIANTDGVLASVAEIGGVIQILTHYAQTGGDTAVVLSPAQFGLVLDEALRWASKVEVMKSVGDAFDEIIANSTDNGDGTLTRAWTDASNYNLMATSPAIDAGVAIPGLTADILGNPIYGTPDLGGYEYQPPYTVGTNNIPTTGSARIYTNGKYRMTTASSTSATAGLTITPAGGSYQATTTQYMDITIDTWNTSGNYSKQWTATSTTGSFLTHATSTVYTVPNLNPLSPYSLLIDGVATTTAITDSAQCTSSVCTADGSGQIQFTYTGGYSTHTFGIQDLTAPTLTEVTAVAATTTDNTPSYTFSSDESGTILYAGSCSSSTTSITASTNTTVTFATLSDGTYTNCKVSVLDAAGNNSATTTLSSFVVDTTDPSVSASSPTGTITNSKPTFSWSGSDATAGVASYALYLDGSQAASGSSASYTPTSALSCGDHTWYVQATDGASNTTNSSTQSFSVSCGGGGIFTGPVSSLPGYVAPRPQMITPDGKVTYLDDVASTTEKEVAPTVGLAAQIATLLAQVASLQAQLKTPIPSTTVIMFTRTLRLGVAGSDVTRLQELLKKDPTIYPEGRITGYFGPLTERALQRFQLKYGIVSSGTPQTTGYGIVGPKTRATLNTLVGE